jgi:hypothetical protein
MKEPESSISNWKSLYDAAVEFKGIACWDWMLDSDVFGVQNPANGEIGYCCVMGHLGEHFALGVYLGTEGLETYLKIQNREITEDDIEAFMSQKCLMASFEDRDALSEEDRKIIKRLGLRFRGRNQWPLFRKYQPGYPPWYLAKDEAEYLALALRQAIEVSLRFREDPDILIHRKRNHYLVRVPRKTDGRWQWRDEWLKPAPVEESKIMVPPINEVRLQRIKKTIKRRGGTWEADFFFSPTPVREGKERPYYPYAAIYVDSYSGLILHADMVKPTEHTTEFPNSVMGLIENVGMRPNEILVRKEEAFELLKLIASRLDINLKLVKRLKMLEHVQASMFQFFC